MGKRDGEAGMFALDCVPTQALIKELMRRSGTGLIFLDDIPGEREYCGEQWGNRFTLLGLSGWVSDRIRQRFNEETNEDE